MSSVVKVEYSKLRLRIPRFIVIVHVMGTSWLANAHHENFWPHHSWPEFAALSDDARARTSVVLPVHGFADHGLGLPLDAEEVAGGEILKRAAMECDSLLVLPPLRFALAPYQRSTFFGVDADTAYDHMREIVKSVKSAGFRKIIFFNTSPWNEELAATVALDTHVDWEMENRVVNVSRLGMSFHPGAPAPARANAQAAAMRVLGLSAADVRANLERAGEADVRDADFRPGNFQQPEPLAPDESLDGETVLTAVAAHLAQRLGARASRPPKQAGATPALPGKGWHSRDYLPHFDQPGLVQSITFRLHDSVPAKVIEQWRVELDCNDDGTAVPSDDPRAVELRKRIAEYEDAGHGACHLRDAGIAALVENALLHFDGERYALLEWCVMPNHVHALIATREGHAVSDIVHSWKSFVAKKANAILGGQGAFWMSDYHDRYVRDAGHLASIREYIRNNPVKAGLVKTAQAWRFGSAGHPGSAGVPPAQTSGRDARAPRNYLPSFTPAQIDALPDKHNALVIISTGAIEQHGPHLPVGVDAILGQALLAGTLPKLSAETARRVFVAPPLTFGKSNEHDGFPGTITVSARTLRRVLCEVAAELCSMGFGRIAILNTHGGNSPVIVYTLREIQSTLGMRAGMLKAPLSPELSEHEAKNGIHAGEWETALMLACAPELVRMDKAVREYPARPLDSFAWMTRDVSQSGVMGDATAATAEKGRAWMDAATAALAARISRLL
ncbi:creatinine amidohydrolase/Fe(II)-dependent formamide hydrolase-like protein/REP element-mobilizing transposase RayT [Ereboglobus sp. PH5-10]|uniref:creatininase family protein n=1 Tax=Ereboglobus sp. PH5-10 TaxID=2940629 RepID=UPI00240773F1|nr:creatininase family protein [Ereboglobus sp. PH5-10]MDF9826276.1 creatinine amidohydrolase/Fe(II)-dependent formamide hydrolase-like protein/REP element-mobilizing transposase RayT [Ereboglobus sp. PH5-10]